VRTIFCDGRTERKQYVSPGCGDPVRNDNVSDYRCMLASGSNKNETGLEANRQII
jgi:hypothetical protein